MCLQYSPLTLLPDSLRATLIPSQNKSRPQRLKDSKSPPTLTDFIGGAGFTTQSHAQIPQDGKGPCKEGTSLAVQRGKTMSNVLFPTLVLSSHLCPGEVIHTLSPNCPSYPEPTSLLWCLTIQPPLPSSKELQGAMLRLSACYPFNSCPLWLVIRPRFPPLPKITFFQNRHCRPNHQLQWHF